MPDAHCGKSVRRSYPLQTSPWHMILLISSALSLSLVAAASAETDANETASLKAQWQQYLEGRNFGITQSPRGLVSSLMHHKSNSDMSIVVHYSADAGTRKLFLTWLHEGKVILELPGYIESQFRAYGNTLYIADYHTLAPGCRVVAYDLTTGKEIWATDEISRLPRAATGSYGNQVHLRLSRRNEIPGQEEGATVIVTGREGFGNYIAIIDASSGAVLAQKIYKRNVRPQFSGGE